MREDFLREAIQLAREGAENLEGGPFGAVIVQGEKIVGRGNNQVPSRNDPTAHAEIEAIRDACRRLGRFELRGCEIYASCEPCPMCLSAIHWARLDHIFYAASRDDAAAIGFDDALLYEQIALPPEERDLPMQQALRQESLAIMHAWERLDGKTRY